MTKTEREKALRAFINEKKEPVNTQLCSCMTCKHALLHRYGTNPVLAACEAKPQPGNAKFPYEVMVASTVWKCPLYKREEGDKWIQPREAKTA